MWLDRFAAQASASRSSSPQLGGGGGGSSAGSGGGGGGRPFSSPSRRPTANLSPYVTSHRPAIQPRGSSLSLVSNDSAGSLLPSSRQNGVKESIPAPRDDDCVKVLDHLLAEPDLEEASPWWQDSITPGDLALDFEFDAHSVQELAEGNPGPESEPDDTSPDPAGSQSSQHDAAKFDALHQSIQTCDHVLNSVEINLASFRNDLAAVSADIESLQARSAHLKVRLENRIAVERALAPLVDELSLSPTLISKIVDGHIDELWAKALGEVDRRVATYGANSASPDQSKAWLELGPLLEKLVAKALERIRDFLVTQIKSLRSPHINAQVIQQQTLLKYHPLFAFLHAHSPALADEICQAYLNTMRWYYAAQFSRYEKALEKIRLHILAKTDTIGYEDTSWKTGVLSGSKVAAPPHDAFSIGRRIDLLKTSSRAALPAHLAEEDHGTHYIEVPFRNFSLALVDNAAAEYGFLVGFFAPPYSLATIFRHFNYVFEPTFAIGQALTKTLVTETYDCLGLLICIRLNQQFAFDLQRRKVPTVDGYINATSMLLWPRLQVVMGRHCESIRLLYQALPAKPNNRFSADQAKQSAAPHLLTQQFGQLLHGILSLCSEAGDDEPVVTSLRRLGSEIEVFLGRHCQAYCVDKRRRERFLYNNYSLILTIISDVGGKQAADWRDHFEKLKEAHGEVV